MKIHKKTAILGGTGLVGFHIFQWLPWSSVYDSKNIGEIAGQEYDEIYCACVPAVKWIANTQPDEDAKVLEELKRHLKSIKRCDRFTLISTIDVHRVRSPVKDEDEDFLSTEEPYGRNRRELERWISGRFVKVHVIRLPALFGIGLKKNVLYDLMNARRLEHIDAYDEFQWYDLRWLQDDVRRMHLEGIKVLNAYPDPVQTTEIIKRFFPRLAPLMKEQCREPVKYGHGTKHSFVRRSGGEVLSCMQNFLFVMNAPVERVAVSSQHWKPLEEDDAALTLLARYGVRKVELLPWTYVKPGGDETEERAMNLKNTWTNRGMSVSSLQGIMHGIEGTIRNAKNAIAERLRTTDDVARAVGAKTLVFGSPGLRTEGDQEDVIRILEAYEGKAKLCVEHVSSEYGCNVMTRYGEVCEALRDERVKDKDNVGINMDLGNAHMEGEKLHVSSNVGHVQVSMPHLRRMDRKVLLSYPGDLLAHSIRASEDLVVTMEVRGEIQTLGSDLYTFLEWLGSITGIGKDESDRKDALIVGCGWYGCHAASLLLERGRSFDMIDSSDGFFKGSSGRNQNRLHLGFHYPRSIETRTECAEGFEEMLYRYPNAVSNVRSYYAISKESKTDYDAYLRIFNHPRPRYVLNRWEDMDPVVMNTEKCEGLPLLVEEMFIDHETTGEMFSNLLNTYRIDSSNAAEHLTNHRYDHIFDCTYGRMLRRHEEFDYEDCVSFVLRARKIDMEPLAITVMDGDFFSVFPYRIEEKLYTLTHVRHTVIREKGLNVNEVLEAMVADVKKYILNFDDLFEIVSYFTSTKTKRKDGAGSSDRSLAYERTGNYHSFVGGKITGIFRLDETIDELLSER